MAHDARPHGRRGLKGLLGLKRKQETLRQLSPHARAARTGQCLDGGLSVSVQRSSSRLTGSLQGHGAAPEKSHQLVRLNGGEDLCVFSGAHPESLIGNRLSFCGKTQLSPWGGE